MGNHIRSFVWSDTFQETYDFIILIIIIETLQIKDKLSLFSYEKMFVCEELYDLHKHRGA